jgi:hypothetical protein
MEKLFEIAAKISNQWSLAVFAIAGVVAIVLRLSGKRSPKIAWAVVLAVVVLGTVPILAPIYLNNLGLYRVRITVTRKGSLLFRAAASWTVVLSNPVAHEGGLSRKASLAQFTPELAGIVTTLLPALAQIFAMSINLRGARSRLSLRKSVGANPTTNRPNAKAATTSDIDLSDALTHLLHHRFIAGQAAFSVLLLPHLLSERSRIGLQCI